MNKFLLLFVALLLAGCEQRPDLDVEFELIGDEFYVCFLHIQNRGANPVKVSRINLNQEMDLPLQDGELVLLPGQKITSSYNLYEWPRPREVVLQTNEGIYRQSYDGPWPNLAVIVEAARRAKNPNVAPVPAPTPTAQQAGIIRLAVESRDSWPSAGIDFPSVPTPEPTASPTPMPAITPMPGLSPATAPVAVVSSKNPEYAGSFINRTSNESSALLLTFETFIPASDGRIEVGGKMRLGTFAPFAVSGTFVLATGEIILNQASPVKASWTGTLAGKNLKGTFRGKSFGREENGIWECSHAGGIDIYQASGLSNASQNIDSSPAQLASSEYLAVPLDLSMTRFMLFSTAQNRVVGSRVWEFNRAIRPSEVLEMDGKKAIVVEPK